jgi:hypothetical protein
MSSATEEEEEALREAERGAPGTEPQTEGFQEPSQVEREEEFVEEHGAAGESDVQLPG